MDKDLVCLVGVNDVQGSTNISQAKAFMRGGFQVIPINYRTLISRYGMKTFEDLLITTVKKHRPYLTLFSKTNGMSSNLIKECSKYSNTWYWFMDPIKTAERIPEVITHAQNADFVSCTGGGVAKWFEENGVEKCYTVFDGLDVDVFKPVELLGNLKSDVSLIGTKTKEREEVREALLKAGLTVSFYGDGYQYKAINEAFSQVCSSSKFMLSINSSTEKTIDYFSNRLLRYMGCGSCVLHYDPTDSLKKYFKDGEEILFFKTIEELINKIKNIDDETAKKIGEAGRKKVLENYTWEHTIQNILNIIKSKPKKETKNAIVITNVGRNEIWDVAKKSVERYCSKYNISLEVITEAKLNLSGVPESYNYTNFEKYQTYNYFDKYDRILRLDCDIIISPDCPNLFDIVPEDSVGVVFEDVGSRKEHRRNNNIIKIQEQLGNVGWNKDYFNGGVIVCSRCHRELFNITEEDRYVIKNNDFGGVSKEQSFLNWRVHKLNFKLFELDYRFNHMTMFSEPWNNNANRYNSFILHYAGQGKFIKCNSKYDNMLIDENYFFSKNIQTLTLKDLAIIDAFPINSIKSCLNVGCGKGRLDYHLKKKGVPVISTDVKEDKLVSNTLDFFVCDIFNIDSFPIKNADVVICSQVLEHLFNYKTALKNLLKLTKNRLIITIPYKTSFYSEDHINFWDDKESDKFNSIDEFIELSKPYSVEISKIITKEADKNTGSRNYLIVIDKEVKK